MSSLSFTVQVSLEQVTQQSALTCEALLQEISPRGGEERRTNAWGLSCQGAFFWGAAGVGGGTGSSMRR